jgi:hypothetical protein
MGRDDEKFGSLWSGPLPGKVEFFFNSIQVLVSAAVELRRDKRTVTTHYAIGGKMGKEERSHVRRNID